MLQVGHCHLSRTRLSSHGTPSASYRIQETKTVKYGTGLHQEQKRLNGLHKNGRKEGRKGGREGGRKGRREGGRKEGKKEGRKERRKEGKKESKQTAESTTAWKIRK